MLESIEGRSTDFVVAADGTILHGLSLIYILRDMESVESFKIVQHDIDNTHVQVVSKTGEVNQEMRDTISQGFKARLGETVNISIENVREIEPEKSGKYRYVISKVSVG